MGKRTIWSWVRGIIGGLGWKVFIWSLPMTEDEYREAIYQQEKEIKDGLRWIDKVLD